MDCSVSEEFVEPIEFIEHLFTMSSTVLAVSLQSRSRQSGCFRDSFQKRLLAFNSGGSGTRDELRLKINMTSRVCDAYALTMNRKCVRSEEHTSELQSQFHLVCRLLL